MVDEKGSLKDDMSSLVRSPPESGQSGSSVSRG